MRVSCDTWQGRVGGRLVRSCGGRAAYGQTTKLLLTPTVQFTSFCGYHRPVATDCELAEPLDWPPAATDRDSVDAMTEHDGH